MSIVFAVASIVLICWSAVASAGASGAFVKDENEWCSNNPSLQSVSKSNGYCTITFVFSDVRYSEKLYGVFLFNRDSGEDISGVTTYVNGAAVDFSEPLNYAPATVDTLQVVFPCDNLTAETEIRVEMIGDCFGCGGSVILP
jgi:hypothetical protein